MVKIPTRKVLVNVVQHYVTVYPNTSKDTIWQWVGKWVEKDYNGKVVFNSQDICYEFVFNNDTDALALAFKLKFTGCRSA